MINKIIIVVKSIVHLLEPIPEKFLVNFKDQKI